jgi:hypothetical protein
LKKKDKREGGERNRGKRKKGRGAKKKTRQN